MPLNRRDLDSMTCASPDCTAHDHEALFLHALCHLEADLQCQYIGGIVTLLCGECDALVAKIQVCNIVRVDQ